VNGYEVFRGLRLKPAESAKPRTTFSNRLDSGPPDITSLDDPDLEF
jgi:hypothetical protein